MAVGVVVKIVISLAYLLPGEIGFALPVLPKAELALEIAPALLGVGYILGYRQAAVCVAGALVSAVVITPLIAWMGAAMTQPLYPETQRLIVDMDAGDIWSRYVRYIGAGAVATAGILTVLRGLPTMVDAFTSVARGMQDSDARGGGATLRTDRDLPGSFVFGGVAIVVLTAGLVPGVFAGEMAPLQRAILACGVGVFGVLFVAVAARIVGIVGVSSQPTSGIALVTLLGTASIFAAAGWVNLDARAGVLTVGTIVAVAASKAGDISQDLKTGWLLGATPARQQLGQLIGAAFACWAVAATVMLLGNAYEFGSKEIPAPQATLMKTIIEGVLAGSAALGPGADRRRPRDRRDAVRRVRARVLDRHLPAARDDGAAVRRRLRAGTGRAQPRAGCGGRKRHRHPGGFGPRRRRRPGGRCHRGSRCGGHCAEGDRSAAGWPGRRGRRAARRARGLLLPVAWRAPGRVRDSCLNPPPAELDALAQCCASHPSRTCSLPAGRCTPSLLRRYSTSCAVRANSAARR